MRFDVAEAKMNSLISNKWKGNCCSGSTGFQYATINKS